MIVFSSKPLGKGKNMDSVMLREKVWDDLLTLPEDAFLVVREFVLFQKNRSVLSDTKQSRITNLTRKSTALAKLLKFKGSLTRDIDITTELGEALDEKHKRSL